MGGVREDEATGGVREGDGGRGVQRDHMGRGGGPVVPGDRAGEGGDGEGGGRAAGERDQEYRLVFGAPGSGVL